MKSRRTAKRMSPLTELVELQLRIEWLPELSPIEEAKVDHALALDQLYYSTRVEGVVLTREMLDAAIYGKEDWAA